MNNNEIQKIFVKRLHKIQKICYNKKEIFGKNE